MCDDIEDCCASSEIASRHDAAVAAGNPTYNDPKTGYSVFTATALAARKKCCGCGCRHCPFNHAAVPVQRRAAKIQTPALLRGSLVELDADAGIDVLLWSGGKDSLLAARALCREHGNKRRLVLLTTFDAGSRQVAHQEVQIDAICEQAESLDLPLVGCPLVPHIPYGTRLDEVTPPTANTQPPPKPLPASPPLVQRRSGSCRDLRRRRWRGSAPATFTSSTSPHGARSASGRRCERLAQRCTVRSGRRRMNP
mmetsp:Transcript_43782/g.143538  ORF Transcript_43782/g.143538 Transcript_43782/m.143538 type:complete len:253 (-) Transcript_43782:240-998(-)